MMSKSVDIALIQPPGWAVQNPSLGLALLKSYLSDQGISVKIFDLNIQLFNLKYGIYENSWEISNGYFTWERESYIHQFFSDYSDEVLNFIYSVLSSKPRVIGFSVHSSSFIATKVLAQKFRECAPDIPLICGGPQVAHYTDVWQPLLTSKLMDAVIFGEGEVSLTEYLNRRGILEDQKIPGVAFRNDSGKIVDGGTRDLIPSLDNLPFADFSDFDLNQYAGRNVLPTYFSRGCINNCIFCTERNFFPKFRNRSGQRVFDEILYQLSLYPQTEYFRLHDSVSNGNMKDLEKFCDLLIANQVKIGWNLENAVIRKEMDAPFYKKLKKSGCALIGYGLENPSKRLLKSIGKHACQTADFDKVISEGVKAKITIGINMMFGLPGETDDDFNHQLGFIKRHSKDRKWIVVNPALNYCYIPKGCAIDLHPDQFNIDLSKGELYWTSKDQKNTYLKRMEKFETFCKYANELGYSNLFNINQLINKNELLGNYYVKNEDFKTGIGYLKKSFEDELKTPDLAKEIICLYEKLSLVKDDYYYKIIDFKQKSDNTELVWLNTPKNRDELDNYIITSPVSKKISRLTSIYTILEPAYCQPSFSISGIKNYLRYQLLRVLNKPDKRYEILIHLLKDIDNKFYALEHQYKTKK